SGFLAGVWLIGCVESGGPVSRPAPPPLLSEPIGIQLLRAEPHLAGMPFYVLLDFEEKTDLSFITPTGAVESNDTAHTGRSSLKIAGEQSATVKLGSLLSGAFPAKWAVAGSYMRSSGPAKVTVYYQSSIAGPP